jgi:hypothetical protein
VHGVVPKVGTDESDVGLAGGGFDGGAPGHNELAGMSHSPSLRRHVAASTQSDSSGFILFIGGAEWAWGRRELPPDHPIFAALAVLVQYHEKGIAKARKVMDLHQA